ncbi:MAG: UUP1 family membrane protein [Burkholderiales bacterium]|nr:UUP1 family membrane protein [Burkholderiales bacterium]
MKRVHLYSLTAVLCAVSLSMFYYKVVYLGFPTMPEQRSEVWRIEAAIEFEASGGPAKVTLQLPQHIAPWVLVDQSFVSRGYGLTTELHDEGQRAIFSTREAQGTQTLYYRATVLRSRHPDAVAEPRPVLPKPRFEGAELVAAQAIVASALQQSADEPTHAALILKRLQEARPGDEASVLLGREPSKKRLVNVAVDLLRLADIPSRVVNGVALSPERRNAGFVHWLEVYHKGAWTSIHIGEPRTDALDYYLPWWRGRLPFVSVEGGDRAHQTVTTSRAYELSMRVAMSEQRTLEQRLLGFSLFTLPLQAQALYRTILVIPVGILLLVALRNIVGIKTFGTFMPVLIAIAFRQTGLGWGIVFFSIVVALGLAVRFYLEHLKLLLVPRLAAVVTVVVLLLAVLSVLSYKLGLDRGLSVGLFPIVILTMTIERMTVVWEERGAGEALQQAAGSLLVGVLCYLVMHAAYIEHLTFVFPELLLIVLAAILLLGRYTGYRLVELRRFKVLAGR